MEFSLSGNTLKTFARSITFLARVGNELVIQSSQSQLAFYTLNSSRSAYLAITFKLDFFDAYTVTGNEVKYSVLLKAICSVLRTPITSIDHLKVHLHNPYASKVQWTLECYNGMKKAYWINCNVEPDIQHLSLDRTRFPSDLIVKPRDLNRLLSNFQSSLQEITFIATDTTSLPSGAASDFGGKAVELRSYIDPTKDNDSSLHTQLWIDPSEEFVHYSHASDPIDVTFGLKELKAFLSFCEGCEVDIHLYFEKAGEPILIAPKFSLDDATSSNFDAALVLATMLVSQLPQCNPSEHQPTANAVNSEANGRNGSQAHVNSCRAEQPSDYTKIWSEISGSAARSGKGANNKQVEAEKYLNASDQRDLERISTMQIYKATSSRENMSTQPNPFHPMGKNQDEDPRDRSERNAQASQHHPNNWIDGEKDGDDDGDVDDNDLCVQSTPTYCED